VQDYKLMRRNQYEKLNNPLALSLDLKNVPLNLYEARNAVEIARARGADHYAPEVYTKAEASLKMAENALTRKDNKKQIITLANQTTQFSEDARALTLERQEAERIENARLAAAAKAKADAEAKAAVEAAEAKRRADEEARRQQELASAREAQLKAEADAKAALARAEAAAKEAQLKAEAAAKEAQAKAEAAAIKAQADIAAAKAQAEADALKAKEEAARAEAEKAQQAARDLRAQLLDQFNRILETRDSVRGLVVTMADVLFDIGKYDLRPPTRESLAKFAGIVLAHPGLKIEVEGHTDSTGSDELNQKLSEQRADTVRTFLISQGLDGNAITSKGFGKDMPVASNDTADGRRKNRRVELIVSGQVIGVTIGSLDRREPIAGGTAETAGLNQPNH
jgi:outer membrane protein OmpA-like peptidoglycan-associated protein